MSKKIYAFFSTALFSALAVALTPIPSAADVCQGSQCQVTFSYTGAPQTWMVPDGASNISFDVQGASGGRNGGLGGRVTGTLSGSFTQLSIYVGGAGQTGAQVNGGFNGGGRSGGHRTNEGSGGGASDIRLSNSLESRLVVAGGGGGTGGFSGGPGGHGGGEIASNGQAGQGGGGAGGTQTQGGAPGANNGGSALATAGSFGQGGSGGVSWNAGGGGGGGGWYGGGGGGSDDDDCCGDGGGGGGGSSYANQSVTNNVVHTSGFNYGNGVVVIRYELTPQLVSFSGQQLSTRTAVFSLEYNMSLSGLELSDFILSGAGCNISSLQVVGKRHDILVENCHENPQLSIAPNSFTIFSSAPASTLSSVVELDQVGPSPSFSHSITSYSSLVLQISVSDAVNVPATSSFTVAGCDSTFSTLNPHVEILLESCVEGINQIMINHGAFQDQYGNLSNTISHSILFDYSSPTLAWSNNQITGNDPFAVTLNLQGNEPFTLPQDAITVSGSAQSCSHTVTHQQNSYLLAFQDCSEGSLVIELAANSATDRVGHTGPASTVSTLIQLARAIPAVSSGIDESYSSAPVSMTPLPSDPTQSPELQSESAVVPPSDPWSGEEQVAEEFPVKTEIAPRSKYVDSDNTKDSEVLTTQEFPATQKSETPLAKPVSFQLAATEGEESNLWLAALVVIAVLGLGGAGAMLLRLAENNRARSIE